ncbi:hypothetical protein [Bradyrhizobium elkanii]|uniref:hypothetical protein n=1 Tax=Bradyrhizobium elkanii TaxID=29448 RepID=UPI000570578F|nr:hypothetical protein [Bradyrhizobium elkanii]WLA79612.1 hypothetical protein QNJ99_29975 [Bradyrhizobium elkanii]
MKDDDIINDYEREATAQRLTVVRTLHAGDNKAEFARRLKILPSRWNNFERGWPLTMNVAYLLVKFDDRLSISYLTHGQMGDVAPELRSKLKALEQELFPSNGEANRRRMKEEKARKLRRQAAELESELRRSSSKVGKGRAKQI